MEKCPNKTLGETGALRCDTRRHRPSGSSGGKDHPQPLVPISKGHQSGLLLHAGILRRSAVRTGPRLAHESRAAQGFGDKVRLYRCCQYQSKNNCTLEVWFFFAALLSRFYVHPILIFDQGPKFDVLRLTPNHYALASSSFVPVIDPAQSLQTHLSHLLLD